jgi:predicted kinase
VGNVYLLVGLPGSGKTTLAKSLEGQFGAVRFTLDEWMMSLCDYSITDPEYGPLASRVKERIWRTALLFLDRNIDVVLDWSLWSKELRHQWISRVEKSGHKYQLYFLEASFDHVERLLIARNKKLPENCHSIPIEEFRRFTKIFEPPHPSEKIQYQVIENR